MTEIEEKLLAIAAWSYGRERVLEWLSQPAPTFPGIDLLGVVGEMWAVLSLESRLVAILWSEDLSDAAMSRAERGER
jgi:hypothetical protein